MLLHELKEDIRMGFRKKLLIGFAAIMGIMVFLGVYGLYEMKLINSNVEQMYNNQLKGLYYIKDAHYNLIKTQSAEKNVLLAGN